MSLTKRASLIIYRFREKGLEIFLVNDAERKQWGLPEGLDAEKQSPIKGDKMIELDPVEQDSGSVEGAWAVESDWHEIPSLKGMLYEDAKQLKDKLMDMEHGTFFVLKEAVKKVMPHQYKFLKELKDILIDRNSVRDL
ncbi:MAG: hypothetical protein MI974_20765 [Chitinophagales bacterium]|nr:hypothetical protein [Chitinophagales bacterium]